MRACYPDAVPKPAVLVVGAGAVGQVYGRHAQLGGADVTFFVREKYRDEVARGLDLYPLNRRFRKGPDPIRWDAFDVVSRVDEVAARSFDHVILTVSSPALKGPWLGELIAAAKDASIVALQPGRGDRDTILAAGAPADRVVSGMITLISYAAPLPGETRFPRPGMAYWFPPMAPAPFSGPRDRVDAIVSILKRGGQPAKRHKDVPRAVAFPSAILMAYLVALENAGWSFRALVRGPIKDGARAARAALTIVAHDEGGKVPLSARLMARPRVLRTGLWLGRRVVPLPLEVYLKEHFIKVGEQTREFVAGYIARGRELGLPVDALAAQLDALTPAAPADRRRHAP
jgi:2-dehydropantoate 2-reductase